MKNKFMMDKKAQAVRNYLIIILIASLAFAVIAAIIGGMNVYYPVANASTGFASTYNYSAGITNSSSSIQVKLENFDQTSLWGQLGILIEVVVFAGKEAVKAIPHGVSMISGIGTSWGIPGFVLGILITILIIVIVFSIISAWNKSEI